MGMYTRLELVAPIKADATEAIAVLDGLVNDAAEPDELSQTPDHPVFQERRLTMIFHGASAYFPTGATTFTEEDGRRILRISSSIKNYNNEYGQLLDWLGPFIDALPGQALGFTKYEETPQVPVIMSNAGPELTVCGIDPYDYMGDDSDNHPVLAELGDPRHADFTSSPVLAAGLLLVMVRDDVNYDRRLNTVSDWFYRAMIHTGFFGPDFREDED